MARRALLIISAVLVTALHAQSAAAAPSAVQAAFGNTVLIVDPDGRSRKIWLKPNGTWAGRSRRGLQLAGTWTAKDDKVCMSQSKPRIFGSMCQALPNFGESVEAKDPSGGTVHLKLVKGHGG